MTNAQPITVGSLIHVDGETIQVREIWTNGFNGKPWVSYSTTDGKRHGCCDMEILADKLRLG